MEYITLHNWYNLDITIYIYIYYADIFDWQYDRQLGFDQKYGEVNQQEHGYNKGR